MSIIEDLYTFVEFSGIRTRIDDTRYLFDKMDARQLSKNPHKGVSLRPPLSSTSINEKLVPRLRIVLQESRVHPVRVGLACPKQIREEKLEDTLIYPICE